MPALTSIGPHMRREAFIGHQHHQALSLTGPQVAAVLAVALVPVPLLMAALSPTAAIAVAKGKDDASGWANKR